MKYVIVKLDDERVINELGQDELKNMYYKIDRVYAGVWNMRRVSGAECGYEDKEAHVYEGDLEYQEVVGASIGIEKYFWWMKKYATFWGIYDTDDEELEDLIEGLFNSDI